MMKRGRSEKSTLPICEIELAKFVTPHGYAVEVHKVMSLMLYPNDKTARTSFVMSANYDYLSRSAAAMSPPGFVTISNKPRDIEVRPTEKFIVEAMVPRLSKRGAKRTMELNELYSGPNIAAAILRRAFKLAHEGHTEIGIEKILAAQSEAYKLEGLVGVGRDKLIEVWYEYRPIAHIAAAFIKVKGHSLQDRKVFFNWIGLAHDILSDAAEIGNRFAEPILPPDKCWRVLLGPTAGGRARPENSRASVLSTSKLPWSQ